ncbi:hypothetical protein CBL_12437 [Carabus blaptoides fortunei]
MSDNSTKWSISVAYAPPKPLKDWGWCASLASRHGPASLGFVSASSGRVPDINPLELYTYLTKEQPVLVVGRRRVGTILLSRTDRDTRSLNNTFHREDCCVDGRTTTRLQ